MTTERADQLKVGAIYGLFVTTGNCNKLQKGKSGALTHVQDDLLYHIAWGLSKEFLSTDTFYEKKLALGSLISNIIIFSQEVCSVAIQ